jgi:hypothetical protein
MFWQRPLVTATICAPNVLTFSLLCYFTPGKEQSFTADISNTWKKMRQLRLPCDYFGRRKLFAFFPVTKPQLFDTEI